MTGPCSSSIAGAGSSTPGTRLSRPGRPIAIAVPRGGRRSRSTPGYPAAGGQFPASDNSGQQAASWARCLSLTAVSATALVRAMTAVEVAELRLDDFDALAEEDPRLGLQILFDLGRILAQRLRRPERHRCLSRLS